MPTRGCRARSPQSLIRLNQYAQSHFQREERLQQAVGYKLSEAHHHRHRALTHELDAMRAEWETPAHPRT
jgi:hemerythrin-like metal-binding protein